MLRIADIKKERDRIIAGLKKKKVANAETEVEKLIDKDESRKTISQTNNKQMVVFFEPDWRNDMGFPVMLFGN